MADSGLTSSDVLALADRNDNGFGSGTMAFWIFALLLLNNGGYGIGGNAAGVVTPSELANSQAAQTNQLQLQAIGEQLSNNRYDIATAIQQQTSDMMQQNNTNLINAIQGFNNIGLQITNQANNLSGQISQLSAQMNECCCSIKTQMLEDRLSDTQAKLVTAQNAIDNANQSQYLLGQLGRFVAWTGSGSQSAATT